jgi:uncharacterized protein YqjF (DUF2071 family)
VDHDFNASALKDVAHRPWKMPESPWVMTQTWRDLLFAHWPFDSRLLQSKIPAAFPLDLFDGVAWVGVVPFRMTNVAPRGVPSLPGISEFPELNVRTYVRVGDKPGVYFFSLDAASSLAVRAARTLLNLPYYNAAMSVTPIADDFAYQSRRTNGAAEFAGTYGPTAEASAPSEGSLEYFLTERYCLYNMDHRGWPYRLDIHHPMWSLQPAQAKLTRNTMAEASGLTLPEQPPLLHFSARQDMVAWAPVRIR